ncbi:MAG: hypothetical protein F6K65_43050, partial [Moorea sp. SIO3C2]|nr:hypothetical protein [Moorena sp. SIO3C2]
MDARPAFSDRMAERPRLFAFGVRCRVGLRVKSINSCLLPLAYCLLPIASCLLPIAYCLLPIAYCLFPIAYCLFP